MFYHDTPEFAALVCTSGFLKPQSTSFYAGSGKSFESVATKVLLRGTRLAVNGI
ncbi:hypothetical protein BH10BAC4_BH10BAC4_25370 [soil metagenome]